MDIVGVVVVVVVVATELTVALPDSKIELSSDDVDDKASMKLTVVW